MEQKTTEVWRTHEDNGKVRPIGVTILIIAHKWDEFEAAFPESDYRKLACKALRYYAHMNGASLVCSQHKDKQVKRSPLEARISEVSMPYHGRADSARQVVGARIHPFMLTTRF